MAKKKVKRRAWTSADVRTLKARARAKTPAAKIARELKRTVGSLRQKALALGVSLNSRAAAPKTAARKTVRRKKTAGKKRRA